MGSMDGAVVARVMLSRNIELTPGVAHSTWSGAFMKQLHPFSFASPDGCLGLLLLAGARAPELPAS